MAMDKPGVLGTIASAFADANVSLAAVQQKGEQRDGRVTLVIITHIASEKASICAAKHQPGNRNLASIIRVEQEKMGNQNNDHEMETL